MATPPNMQKRGTGSGGYRLTSSRNRRKRIWRFATDPADKVHILPGEEAGDPARTPSMQMDKTWIKCGLKGFFLVHLTTISFISVHSCFFL